ncbi:antibiotic biosynthesis monooxygenase family protein [Streptomyces sp. NPDC056049]|uniref:antibiotic biosynthesis monooxygenase family protein n=1 Tax=Streptomyces sp. NPDC056049 TaxID=3345693 RepID=UPI0035DF683F
MRARDTSRPLVIVNRFTVHGDTEVFEHELREHAQFLRRRDGFDFLTTTRLVDRPDVYLHFAHWRSLRDFITMARDATLFARVRRFARMVETEADQAVSLGRTVLRDATAGSASVLLLRAGAVADARAFEKGFSEFTAECARLGGFGGSDLLRSDLSPGGYLGLLWWQDADACDRALADEGLNASRAGLALLAELATERCRHIAYEGALRG